VINVGHQEGFQDRGHQKIADNTRIITPPTPTATPEWVSTESVFIGDEILDKNLGRGWLPIYLLCFCQKIIYFSVLCLCYLLSCTHSIE